jgi:hypothetical protein
MATYARAIANPANFRPLSVVLIVATSLLGTAWAFGAAVSALIASGRIENPHPLEDMTPIFTIPLTLALWVGFLVAGSLWAVWQRAVAVVGIPGGVRDPDWHAEAWFAPVVMWWEPVRNVRELSTYLLAPAHRWLVPAWWASWIAFRFTAWLVIWQLYMPPRNLLQPLAVAIAAAIAATSSSVLAAVLIHLLTTGAVARVRAPFVIEYEKRPYPFSLALFIVGIVCRVATPFVVIWSVDVIPPLFR